ncbi:unnamed protein product [Parnassius mnemosyne]|uniref:Reverse transcriptase domain-containing protein n=1 Tax=Parnassius mnemosyne TaxID=213953 RepID=A0AAV1L5K2_9NEOP
MNLEKAFDRIPSKFVLEAMRAQQISELYIHLVHDMYQDIRTQVRNLTGLSEPFHVKVGVHQGSASSPFLFNLSLGYLTRGPHISRSKTEFFDQILRCISEQYTFNIGVSIDGQPLPYVSKFKYLCLVLTADDNIDADVTHRINAAWLRWRKLSGILYDSSLPIQLKGKIYKMAVRPAFVPPAFVTILYGDECWVAKKINEKKMHTYKLKCYDGQQAYAET